MLRTGCFRELDFIGRLVIIFYKKRNHLSGNTSVVTDFYLSVFFTGVSLLLY